MQVVKLFTLREAVKVEKKVEIFQLFYRGAQRSFSNFFEKYSEWPNSSRNFFPKKEVKV